MVGDGATQGACLPRTLAGGSVLGEGSGSVESSVHVPDAGRMPGVHDGALINGAPGAPFVDATGDAPSIRTSFTAPPHSRC
jgi:hypothetical protein